MALSPVRWSKARPDHKPGENVRIGAVAGWGLHPLEKRRLVTAHVESRRSFMVREIINAAFRELKREFTAEEIDAIDTFRTTAQRLQFETRLKPGEASLVNNYTVMHARSEFDDWDEPEKKRLMLRLWLDVERKPRPVVREIHIYANVGGRSGIDPQPGRLPAVAKFRAPESEVRQRVSAE
jgi:hypothetical protein